MVDFLGKKTVKRRVMTAQAKNSDGKRARYRKAKPSPTYAALDLGTNNCRLLVAKPMPSGFRVVDGYSRIVKLGEGLGNSGELSEEAMERTLEALQDCAQKIEYRRVDRARLIATEACRVAQNAEDFLTLVKDETGLDLEIVNQETEAKLAVSGCASLLHPDAEATVVFDIGGGSTEIIFILHDDDKEFCPIELQQRIKTWTSLPVGVVNLSEKYAHREQGPAVFEDMVEEVAALLEAFDQKSDVWRLIYRKNTYLLGTSGTVTTIAGVHLNLDRYDRNKVDGCWMSDIDVDEVNSRLIHMSYQEKASNPCIGVHRADLLVAGCAILEAIRRTWPCSKLCVADRGLREGLLETMMAEDRKKHFRRHNTIKQRTV